MARKNRSKTQDRGNFKRYFEYTDTGSNAVVRPAKPRKKKNDELSLNEKFAAQYEETQRRKLLQSAPPNLLQNGNVENDDESSSDTSDDEDDLGELLTKRIDRGVRETLDAIRAKDPRIYDSKTRFFGDDDDNDDHGSDDTNSDTGKNDSAAEKDIDVDSDDEPVAGWDAIAKAALSSAQKLTIKDYVRESLLNRGTLSDGEDDDEENDVEVRPDYDHERDEVAKAAASSAALHSNANKAKHDEKYDDGEENAEESDEDEENDSDGEFFTKREKTAEEIAEEEKDFEKFLSKTAKKRSEKAGQDMLLHSYLENETPDEKEQFLRDFVLNNGWLNRNAGDAPSSQTRVVEIDLPVDVEGDNDESDDGNTDDKFDDKADAFEASYNFRFEDPDSTKIATHSREVTGSLRRPDERRKKARKARLQRKLLEKAAKAEELKQLKNAKKREIEARLLAIREAAGDDVVDLKGIDLEGDYDPEKFDKQMQERFGDEYYSREDDAMVDMEADEGATATEVEVARKGKGQAKDPKDSQKSESENFDRLMNEYYQLDYEDIIGGMPVRFKYKEVEPESFNLSPEEILATDDKELNQMVSIKLLAPYRSRKDVQKQAWKVRDMKRKRRIKTEDVTEDKGRPKGKRKIKSGDTLESETRSDVGPSKPNPGDYKLRNEGDASAVEDDNRHKRKRRKKKGMKSDQ